MSEAGLKHPNTSCSAQCLVVWSTTCFLSCDFRTEKRFGSKKSRILYSSTSRSYTPNTSYERSSCISTVPLILLWSSGHSIKTQKLVGIA